MVDDRGGEMFMFVWVRVLVGVRVRGGYACLMFCCLSSSLPFSFSSPGECI